MTSKGFGCTTVVDEKGRLFGILTDGDLRRILQKYGNIFELNVKDVCTKNPKLIDREELATRALKIMEDNSITSLIVVDDLKKPYGILHIHDILRRGIT
jgi:arabinose-5-phosphate isomerase